MIQVSLFENGQKVNEWSVEESKEVSIGRAPACLIRLSDPNISRLHAVMRSGPAGWVLEKKSNYGQLVVNGQEVENAILQGGEEVVVSNYVLRVNIVGEESAAPAMDLATNNAKADEPEPAEVNEVEVPGSVYEQPESSRTNIAVNLASGFLRFEPGMANVAEFIVAKDLIVIGRANSCDVVLFEKKASRKHFEVRRQGLSFYLKDLGSANGTYVNDKKVDSVELIPGDVIRVGDSRCEFSIENKEFFSKRDQFMQIPSAALPEGGINERALVESTKADVELGIPMVGAGGETAEAETGPPEKSLFKRVKKWYWALPKTQRYVVLFLLLMAPGAFFNLGEEPKQKAQSKPTRAADGTLIRRYDDLSDKDKKTVRDAYNDILKSREEKNYQKMLDSVATILRLVNDYRDTKVYETEARKGLEEEERRAQEDKLKEYQERLAKEVALLVQKAQPIFEEALEHADRRSELETLVQEIYSKDPNNGTAQSWQARIRAKIQEEERNHELAEQEKRLKARAEAEFVKLEALIEKGKFVEALQFAETISAIGYTKDGFAERLDEKKEEARNRLSSIINPLIEAGERERAPGGDLVKAKEAFMKVLAVDPENQKANEGLGAIREVLHVRAKRLYAQAIIAESVSSLDEAKQALKRCIEVAPEKDPYRRRCESKLSRYAPFSSEEP